MAKLCPRGKAAAKRKFDVYPSAYANMYASAVCSGKVKSKLKEITTALNKASKMHAAQAKILASIRKKMK